MEQHDKVREIPVLIKILHKFRSNFSIISTTANSTLNCTIRGSLENVIPGNPQAGLGFRVEVGILLTGGSLTFHAKDDHPEIRARVFDLLQSFNLKIFIALRLKAEITDRAKDALKSLSKKLQQRAIYADLVRRLFKNLLQAAVISKP